ncbi:MAG TPA: GNAT family N-acetyltransferase [Novosphingobium sp.]|nr:GNAT family N-acetyltransferase [Novosphingobium sp.]
MSTATVTTERLRMRPWEERDIAPFYAICSDPLVMATLGPLMDLAETAALVARCQALQAEHGHCFWALKRSEDERLIGWCGVIRGTAGPVDGKAELGWRLASDCWGQGYAIEAAQACVAWAFANLPDDALWAITAVDNTRSRAVMGKLGMTYRPELDFDHPKITEGDPLRPHVAYRLERAQWPAA